LARRGDIELPDFRANTALTSCPFRGSVRGDGPERPGD
jgi:hypothetical protein